MIDTTSLRRYASFAAVIVAGLASIATTMVHPKDTKTGNNTLRPDALEAAHHFTVSTSTPHRISLEATIDWGNVVDASAAEVIVEVAEDGSATKVFDSRSMLEFVKSSKDEAQAHLLVSIDKLGCNGSCAQGYTVKLRLEGSRPGEEVHVDWTATADTEAVGESDDIFMTED